jgi:SAM-dependent methyltransferase
LNALALDDIARRLNRDVRKAFEGFSVLDVGCNEGYFCVDALKRGALRVTGIDSNSSFIEQARSRCPQGTFLHTNWWNIPDEQYDIIYFLSTMHYEPNAKGLFEKFRQHLTPNGTFVLECGVVPSSGVGKKSWHIVQRWDGPKRYPTSELLINDLLSGFAVRPIGPSVGQVGDPVPRFVYHCQLKRATALLIYGRSGHGKTVLGTGLEERGIPSFAIDALLIYLWRDSRYEWRKIAQALRKQYPDHTQPDWSAAARFIVENNLSSELAEIIVAECPIGCDIFSIQGEALINDSIRNAVISGLRQRNIKPWLIMPT